MSLSLPANLELNLARQNYLIHQEFCQGLLSKLPEEMRMERKNAGFHHCASAIGALGAAATSSQPKLLEVGIWKAVTTSFFLKSTGTSSKAFGIDIFQFKNQEIETAHILAEQKLLDQCRIFKSPSDKVPSEILTEGASFDVVHIDGSHEFTDVIKDVLMYFHFLKPGGWMIVDDYIDPLHSPDVKPALDQILASNLLPSENHGQPEGFINYWIQKK